MRPARWFLAVSGLVWGPYGLLCLLQPELLAEFAGVAATSTTATIELRAMYGGLEIAVGVICLAGALRPAFTSYALLVDLCLCAGLFLGRLAGVAVAGELSGYTIGTLLFEGGSVVLAVIIYRMLAREDGRLALAGAHG